MEHAARAGGPGPLNRLALMATTHCLTGCAIGEVAGMAVGSALRWSNLATTGARWHSPSSSVTP
jgi:hypothetical protein